jgi:hypothetical protein
MLDEDEEVPQPLSDTSDKTRRSSDSGRSGVLSSLSDTGRQLMHRASALLPCCGVGDASAIQQGPTIGAVGPQWGGGMDDSAAPQAVRDDRVLGRLDQVRGWKEEGGHREGERRRGWREEGSSRVKCGG